jgi:hypothetical protein
MNVEDVKAPEVTGDRLEMIFTRQYELFQKYHPIEKAHGIGHGAMEEPFDIDDPKCQYLCKDFAWRITEEIAESTEARGHLIHAQEETVDAFHFLVELYLINGLTAPLVFKLANIPSVAHMNIFPKDKLDHLFQAYGKSSNFHLAAYFLIETLGKAMNCLKNKPWKQTHILTDVNRFHDLLARALVDWTIYAKSIGVTADSAYDLYFRKSNVNQFRVESKY